MSLRRGDELSWVEPLLLLLLLFLATSFYLVSPEYFKGLAGSPTPSSFLLPLSFAGRNRQTLAAAVKIKRLSRRMIRGGWLVSDKNLRPCGLQLEKKNAREKKKANALTMKSTPQGSENQQLHSVFIEYAPFLPPAAL